MGQWTGRHMTASLQVLEGEWDPLLQWPFNQRVTLRLRDQNNASDKVQQEQHVCLSLHTHGMFNSLLLTFFA
jgi:hypothetical protein